MKKENKTETELKDYITIIFHEHDKNYGYRKIHAVLEDKYNLIVGEKVVRRLMHELGFKSQARKKNKKSVSKIG
ncbi:transposase [Neobacillus niacini]|uniref:transposase n=1 Tax=Neobacillus niacini TaxID=86668 RepID=UPI002781071B|nr:transposase [Neobacillus niacini]MDQ1000378.1 transposase [Neobacillus niacini]